MGVRWRYRTAAVAGATVCVSVAVLVANAPLTQSLLTSVPVLDNLQPTVKTNGDLLDEILTTLVILLAALWPLFKPQPRRILDVIALTHKRVFLAAALLATIGYFDWSTRLPRTTLIATIGVLAVVLPVWFVAIRRRPLTPSRALIVGDDPETIERLYEAADFPILGYVAPGNVQLSDSGSVSQRADGGHPDGSVGSLPRLGGLARLDSVLVEHDVDTLLAGFDDPDREQFFGTLSTSYYHGLRVLVHRDHAASVLVDEATGDELVDTNLEPWDWQDYVLKRAFDFAFAATGLLVLSPVVLCIAVAIKLDSPGPVLYSQQRTAEFGETFTIYKFRSMVKHAESGTGAVLSADDAGDVDPRVTRVGRVLRRTHLDEIPQLWSVLIGDMSVVGPRPERPELEMDIGSSVEAWQTRWFVKPGLTGLAQIHGITGHEPERKLRYDLEYIRNQSFFFDLKIVTRQIYGVFADVVSMVTDDERRE